MFKVREVKNSVFGKSASLQAKGYRGGAGSNGDKPDDLSGNFSNHISDRYKMSENTCMYPGGDDHKCACLSMLLVQRRHCVDRGRNCGRRSVPDHQQDYEGRHGVWRQSWDFRIRDISWAVEAFGNSGRGVFSAGTERDICLGGKEDVKKMRTAVLSVSYSGLYGMGDWRSGVIREQR